MTEQKPPGAAAPLSTDSCLFTVLLLMSQIEYGNNLLMLKDDFKVSSHLRTGGDMSGRDESWEEKQSL